MEEAAGQALAVRVVARTASVLYNEVERLCHPVWAGPFRDGFTEHLENRVRWLHRVTCAEATGYSEYTEKEKRTGNLVRVLASASARAAYILASRLHADRRVIESFFGCRVGHVISVRPGYSDPHDGGQTVTAVEFESGIVLFFKPRPVRFLRRWNALVRRVVKPLFGPAGLPEVLDFGEYGWVEAVHASIPANADFAPRARRAGALLCLAYVVGASDLHAENFIEHADAPVLVDAETLPWSGPERPKGVDRARRAAFDALLRDSVVRTGMLPRWQEAAGVARLAAGVCPQAGPPAYAGAETTEAFEEGFARAYAFLSTGEGARIVTTELASCNGEAARVLMRPTHVYQRVLESSLHEYVHRGRAAQQFMRRRALLHGAGVWGDAAEAVVRREEEALDRLDVPRFTISALREVGVRFESRLGLDFAHRTLKRMCANDFERQMHLIRASCMLVRQT